MKKLFSIILITVMVISLAPGVFADGTSATDGSNLVRAYNFDFGAAGYTGVAGQTGTSEIGYETLKTFGDPEGEINPTWSKAYAPQWVVDGHARATNIALTTVESGNKQANALYWSAFGTRAYQNGVATNTHAVAIRLKIDKPGTYIPELTYHARPDLCIFDIYLVPANSEIMTPANKGYVTIHQTKGENNANLLNRVINNAAAYKLGTLDMYAKEAGRVSTYLIGEHALNAFTVTEETKGEYYLFFRTNGVNDILKKEYGNGNGAAINVNLFSFGLYTEDTGTEEPTVQEKAEAEFTPSTDDSYIGAPEKVTVTTLARYGETSAVIGTKDVSYGEIATVDAVPKTVTREDGTYSFFCWAKGLEDGASRQILSTSNAEISYKPHEGANYLIAVYEKEGGAKEAFYNNNGQLLTDLAIADGVLPALPAMAGRGNATSWIQRGTNNEFAGGATAPTSGDMVFMAKYDEIENNITINGESYSYGDVVSCKDIVDSMENFSCFTRKIGDADAEIISIDENYSFAAYTDCTIEAVCEGPVEIASPKKIALSTFSVGDRLTAIMAEFIGFENAKEKGIMFGSKKIAMISNKAQFTITNGTAADVTVTGYAIVGNDKYIDGKITVDAAK